LSPRDYCLISQRKDQENQGDYTGRLPGKYYFLPPEFKAPQNKASTIAKWRVRLNVLFGTILGLAALVRGRRIAKIVKQEGCGAIVACTSAELLDLPAAYLAGRLTGAAFYAYIFDDYAYVWPQLRFVAALYERFLLKRAAGVIVPNEFMRDELRRRHNIEATVIHNPCDTSKYEPVSRNIPSDNTGEIRIIYTGAIYGAHYDAFRNLLAAIESLHDGNVNLHVYTTFPLSTLNENGISGPLVYHEHLATSAMPGIQKEADILFLPLAFNSPYPEIIRTSAPGKVGEYLAARRPILVHAPPDSFVAWYFRQYECGLVVDRSDSALLAQAIEEILNNAGLRQKLCANAWERAQVDFSIATAREKFARLIGLDVTAPV